MKTGSYFLGQLADLGLRVKRVALGTTKLVWLLKRAPSLSRTMVSQGNIQMLIYGVATTN